jgi:hypothetical protein
VVEGRSALVPIDAPPPKPKPPTSSEGLAEVERALSVLKGRHPEHERVRREDEERRSKRTLEIEAERGVVAAKANRRRLVIGAVGAAALAVVVAAGLAFRSELARRGRLEQAADPFRAMGFALVDWSGRGEPASVEASVPAGCVVAVSTAGSRVELSFGGGAIGAVSGPSPVITCVCEGVTAHAKLAGGAQPQGPSEGLVLLRADAATVGGSRAFAFLPFMPGQVGATDAACAEATLDQWIDAKKWSEPTGGGPSPVTRLEGPARDAWFGQAGKGQRAKLAEAKLEPIGVVKPDAPFGVLEVPPASCLLVVADDEADRSSLRLRGGSLAVGPVAGHLAWCSSAGGLVVLQRADAAGSAGSRGAALTALVAPADRLGGMTGLREAASKAGITLGDGAAVVAPGDHGWNAARVLAASAIPDTLITTANTPEFAPDKEARIVAVSVDKPNLLLSEVPEDVFSYCDPPLETSTSSLCVFSGTQRWSVRGTTEGGGGIARAKLPFWLFALQGVSDPPALRVEVELLDLARKLGREGFEATTIEAVTDTDKGAEVLGRANEDAIVAFGLAPAAPWVFPYTDGPPWTLDLEPRVVPIKPLERVQVGASSKDKLPPKATRRTVVFRRHAR